ncbi:DUF317 domain-containing protein [Streptomyces sp. SID5789]|nr:DUF317 domain-containing protein [Streptomyces sp. SID5789]
MRHFAPQDRVLVSPRYLAGAGIDRLADAIGPLIHLFGWPSEHDRASGRISVHSPDGSLFVNFNSRHTRGHWWSVAHHEPYWEARFTRQTPIEAIAAVTQALPQLLGDDRHIDRIPLTTTPPRADRRTEPLAPRGRHVHLARRPLPPAAHSGGRHPVALPAPRVRRLRHPLGRLLHPGHPRAARRPVLHPPRDDHPGRAHLP